MTKESTNPLLPFLTEQGTMILDGGLATTLEERGFDLDDKLWSARVLLEEPEAVAAVHRDFIAAGADAVTTATYQATLAGLIERGLDRAQALAQLELAVDLAVTARDAFWSNTGNRRNRLRPLVAASIGPYGAYLADGSEYRGHYGLSRRELREFHEERWRILADGPADILACETLPCRDEAAALLELLGATPGRWAWFCFSCRNGSELSDGSPFAEAVALCDAAPRVAGIGVNCSAPEHLDSLLEIARERTSLPLLAYPNSGETYDADIKNWSGGTGPRPLASYAAGWRNRGAGAIGGCCRTSPSDITELRRALLG